MATDFKDLLAIPVDQEKPQPTGEGFADLLSIDVEAPAPQPVAPPAEEGFGDLLAVDTEAQEPAEPTLQARPTPTADIVRGDQGDISEAQKAWIATQKGAKPKTESWTDYKNKVRAALQANPNDPVAQRRWEGIQASQGAEIESAQAKGTAEAQQEIATAGYKGLKPLASGLSMGLTDIPLKAVERGLDIEGVGQAETRGEMLQQTGLQLLGGLVTGKALQKSLSQTAPIASLAGKPMTQALVLRSSAGAIQGASRALSGVATGDKTGKQAAGDIAQSIVSSAVSVLPEGKFNGKMAQFAAEVLTDFLVDAGIDLGLRDRLKDQTFTEWLVNEELMNLIPSIVGAMTPMTKGDYKARLAALKKTTLDPAKERIQKVMDEAGETPEATKVSMADEAKTEAPAGERVVEPKSVSIGEQKVPVIPVTDAQEMTKDPLTFFHGAPRSSAENIKKSGFRKTTGGMNKGRGVSLSQKTFIAEYLIERQANMDTRTRLQAEEDARRNIEQEGGIEQALSNQARGKVREGDTGVMETKMVLSDEEVANRFMAGDEETIAKVQKVVQQHYERGTDIARELAARRDTWETPEGRRSLLLQVLLGGSKNRKLTPQETGKRREKAQEIIQTLRDDDGIDLTKLTDDELMQDDVLIPILGKIAPKTATWRQKFMEFRRFALLSGLKTHEVNIIGNTLRGVHEFTGQRAVEVLLNKATGASKSMGNELTRIKKDSIEQIKDLDKQIRGATNPVVKEQLRQAKQDVLAQRRNAEAAVLNSLPATTKSTIAAYRAMAHAFGRASKLFMNGLKYDQPVAKGDVKADPGSFAAIEGTKGWWIRMPQRALNAADMFASEMLRSGLTADYAAREAQAKGITDVDQIERYVKNSMDNPKSTSAEKATQESLRLTFREKPGDIAAWVLRQRNKPGAVGVAAEMLFPFVTTPASLVKQGVRATPLGAIALRNKLKAETKTKGKKQALSGDEAIKRGAEQIIAWAMTGGLMALINDKDEMGRPKVTGSMPPDATPAERDFLYRNQPPQSIRVGDRWVSYSRIEPLATSLTTVIDSLSAIQGAGDKDIGDTGRDIMKAVTGPFRDKTFLKALGEIIEALSGENRGRSMIDVVNNQVSSLMPNIIRASVRAGQEDFQERRSRRKPEEGLKGFARAQGKQIATSAIPMPADFTTNVRVNHWGEPIKRAVPESGILGMVPETMWRLLSPSEVQEMGTETPIDMAVLAWNNKAEKKDKWFPSRLSDLKVAGDKNSRMTDDEFESYARRRGELAKLLFRGWQPKDPIAPTRVEMDFIKDRFKRAGQIAKTELFNVDIVELKQKELRRKLGVE